jgi:hypothetical protein
MGLSLGTIPLAVLSIAGALATAWILDSLRGEPKAESRDRDSLLKKLDWAQEKLPPEDLKGETAPPQNSPGSPVGTFLRHRRGYQELVDHLKAQDLPAAQKSYQSYQGTPAY